MCFAAVAAFGTSQAAKASLVNSDFLAAGDNLIVTDTATDLEWLSPYLTRGQSVNAVLGGYAGLLTTYGFRFATAAETLSMINNNFGNPPVGYPGTSAAYASAANFFAVFGLNEYVTCQEGFSGPYVPCPRTQGWALDGSTITQLGMIQFGSNGYMIDSANTLGSAGNTTDSQLGEWLVRDAVAATPLPPALVLFASGLGALTLLGRRRKRKATTIAV